MNWLEDKLKVEIKNFLAGSGVFEDVEESHPVIRSGCHHSFARSGVFYITFSGVGRLGCLRSGCDGFGDLDGQDAFACARVGEHYRKLAFFP